MAALSVEQALERLLAGLNTLPSEDVALHDAAGRMLAEDIVARRTQPPFAASAMDGYAIRHADCSHPMTIVGEAAAGHPFDGTVGPAQAVRIFTGAVVPDGADTILIQEDAKRDGDALSALDTPKPGAYVRAAGLDFCEGDVLVKAGTVLDGGHLGLAASGNHAAVACVRRPKVGLLATGDELRLPGEALAPGQIISSNSYGVAAVLRECGAEPVDLGIAHDTEDALNTKLDDAIAHGCDVLITLGGASVGDHDLVKPVFEARGMVLDFWKIAMRPGKPLMSGTFNDMMIIGLPGNPVSSMVCAHVFCAPVIAKLAGRPFAHHRGSAKLQTALPENGPRAHYMRAKTEQDADGLAVAAFNNQDSSMLSLFAKADCLIVRPAHAPACPAGTNVDIIWLNRGR